MLTDAAMLERYARPPAMKPILYLHGFASSIKSTKAQFFRQKMAEFGHILTLLELDEGNFEAMTVTGQLAVIDRAVQETGGPVTLMGSSLGGYLAALYAASHSEVERVILMAPAFRFASRFKERFSPEQLESWRKCGSTPIFHYGSNSLRPLSYEFIEDASRYEEEPDIRQPCLILHGTNDTVVPPEISAEYAARHPNVILRLLPSGHELTDVLDSLWKEVVKFQNL